MSSTIEEMKNEGNVEWLFAFLQDRKDRSEKGWMARLDAAEALAQLGDPRGLAYLHEMAASQNPEVRDISLEILEGLREEPVEPMAAAERPVLPASESMFFRINSRYPYIVAWTAFVILYFIALMLLNPVVTLFYVATQAWLPAQISSLLAMLLLLTAGFFVFRYVIRMFVLPYENKR